MRRVQKSEAAERGIKILGTPLGHPEFAFDQDAPTDVVEPHSRPS